jgi:hypothetical protein
MKRTCVFFVLILILGGVSFADLPHYTPLNDLGKGLYLGRFEGGLYEHGSNNVPPDHDATGKKFASRVAPIQGKIVVLAIGMSNAMDEFGIFLHMNQSNPRLSSHVVLVNGAFGGIGACAYTVPHGSPHDACGGNAPNPYDWALNNRLSKAEVTEDQVQVLWIKEANGMSAQVPWPPSLPDAKADAYAYEKSLGGILRAARVRYPNVKLAFLSSRIYGGYDQNSKNHEPYAYEYGFSVKWAIQSQIDQNERGRPASETTGDLSYSVAPWIAWGPYIWADGPSPRSDGLVWCNGSETPNPPCNGASDFSSDALHPNPIGQMKVAKMLWTFFSTCTYTKGWFLRDK